MPVSYTHLEAVLGALEAPVELGASRRLGAFLLLCLPTLANGGGRIRRALDNRGLYGYGGARCARSGSGRALRQILALEEVVLVITIIHGHLAIADIDHAVGDGAHQMLVVAWFLFI